MTDEEIGAEAVEIANEIERAMGGRSAVACLLALGMVIGRRRWTPSGPASTASWRGYV